MANEFYKLAQRYNFNAIYVRKALECMNLKCKFGHTIIIKTGFSRNIVLLTFAATY